MTQTVPTDWKIQKSVEVVLCNRFTDIPLATQKVPTTEKIQKRLATTRPRASRSSSHRDERREGCRVRGCMLGQDFSSTRTARNPDSSNSGRNSTMVLHRLGTCYMVPGVDYPRYMHSGPQIPKQGDFDSICKQCSRKGAESRTRRFRRYADGLTTVQRELSRAGNTVSPVWPKFESSAKFPSGRGHHIPAPLWEGCRATFLTLLSCLSVLCWLLSLVWLGAGASCGCWFFSLACGFLVVSYPF